MVEEAPFSVPPQELMTLVDPKNQKAFKLLGGTDGLLKSLHSDIQRGIQISSLPSRVSYYGTNRIPAVPQIPFMALVWDAMHDKTLVMLMIASVVSLSIGIYKDVSGPSDHGYSWIEGLAILIAVIIVVLVSSLNDYQKERQFRKLNAKKDDRCVNVIRDGSEQQVSIHDVAVGDVYMLEPGDVVAADGVMLESFQLKCDESGATGESDAIHKQPLEVIHDGRSDPFVLSGTKVIEGVGKCLVIATGTSSFHGKLLMGLQVEKEDTPLQIQLDTLAEKIAKLGAAMALTMLLALGIKFVVNGSLHGFGEPVQIVDRLTSIFIQAVTILVVAVPEGLPMAVTIALAYATSNMLADNNLVRILASCETMGNATTICSDKTGTLTTNIMTVVRGRLFGQDVDVGSIPNLPLMREYPLLAKSIATNSSAFESETDGVKTMVGSKTEVALLNMVRGYDVVGERERAVVLAKMPFSSARKSMSVCIQEDTRMLYFVKGASEVVLGRCTHEMDIEGTEKVLQKDPWMALIGQMAAQCLRTIALAYAEVDQVPQDFPSTLTLLGIVGIQDPVRAGVPEAVLQCQKAGICVRMVTGDNLTTASAIARECHILMRGGLAMEGPKFRALTDAQLTDVVPKLQVLARSSPLDKQILVGKLKAMNEVVAVTGDGTNDGPALKAADVGFAMGITGTEVAKEASSIILMDDNFASIVKAVLWGRCVHDGVRKFLQFQLTVNVTAVSVAFVSALVDESSSSVLTAVQLLWVNLLMDTFAALALATDRPTNELLDRRPESKFSSLVTRSMWKMIIGQSIFQIVLSLCLLYFGPVILKLEDADRLILNTFIFNTFVFCQLFNEINSRILDSSLNPFKGLFRNSIFIVVFLGTILGQILIVTFGGAAFSTTPLNWSLWLVSVSLGLLSLPVGLILRLIPMSESKVDLEARRVVVTKERLQWQAAITDVRHGLSVFTALRREPLRTTPSRLSVKSVEP